MPLKIYKGTDSTGTLLTVSDIKIDLILDAKNVMTFIHDGTTALAKGDSLYCEYDDGASTQLPAFFGYIEEPPQSAVPPQEVMCMGMAGKMDWYIVAEGAAKTLQDKGIINQVNGGDASKLDLYDEEGNAIATTIPYTNLFTDHPVYYVIVSDATKQPSTVTCQNGANNYIGYGNSSTFEDNHGTDHTDVLMSYNAGTYFYGEHTQPTLGTVYYFADQFDFENYGIASTEELTYMRVTWSCTYSVLSTEVNFRNSVTPVLYIGSYELCRGPAIISLNGSTITGEWVSSWSGYIRDVATSIGFTQGDPNWKDGDIRIGLVQQPYNNPPTALALSKKFNMKLRWYALTVEVDHVSQTFDELNIAITDTEVGDTLGCDGTDFGDEGVTANDKWAVGISFNQAIANCFVPEAPIALPDYLYHVCHEGVIVDRGIVKDFFGCTGWEMLSQLVEEIEYHVWEDPVGRTIHIDDYAGMGDAIALNAPHPGSSAISEMPAVEYVYVIWKDGVVAKPTGTEGAKGIYKIQDEGILTEAEAWARATKYATKYANTSYAISLSYTGTPLVANGDLPYVGKRYSVNLYNSDGTTAAYTTQPARRVSISNNGGDEQYYTSVFLGMGSTPTWEKIPKEIMSLKKALSARQFKGMSSTYTPATRHSALNGVAGSTDQYHVSSSQYTNLLVHGDVDDVSVNGADDVPISSNWAYDHENNTTTAHGAVSTNTASKLVVRDANARAQFGDPAAAQDAVTLNYYRYPPKRGLIELIQNEETNTQNIVYSGYQPFADNDTDTGFWRCVMPPDLKAGGKVSLWLILSNDHASGKKITFNQIGLCAAPKNGTFFTYLNDWNGGAADYIKLTTTLDGSVTVKAEHFEVLTDNTGFAAYDAVWLKLIRNASNADDDWGATCYVRAYLTYERDLVGS
jgi:hypothetical protein